VRRHSWPERDPRPKAANLPKEGLEQLHTRAEKFVQKSLILHELVDDVQLCRGRLYLWRGPEDLMARITPLSPRSMLLETQHRNSWVEHKRGQLTSVLNVVEGDTKGSFHGLGSLIGKRRGGKRSVQVVLQRDLKIPVGILAKPEHWYRRHRMPAIAEVSDANDRSLVRFVSDGISGSFHGTCLYAFRDGRWGCYTIRPSASESIATAEKWLNKRDWEDWG
jgi:hypothetical protein